LDLFLPFFKKIAPDTGKNLKITHQKRAPDIAAAGPVHGIFRGYYKKNREIA
jgi:hypothetical protein